MKAQFSIAHLLIVMIPLAVGLAALSNPTPFWEASIFTLTLFVLFTAVLAAIYRTRAVRAFWLGFALFGWGFYVLSSDVSFDFRARNSVGVAGRWWTPVEDDDPPLREITKNLVDYLQLNRRSAPKSVGEKIQVLWNGTYYPCSVLELGERTYKIRYDSDPQGTFDEWVGVGRIKLGDLERSYRIAESLFTLISAVSGALIAVYLHRTRKSDDADGPTHEPIRPLTS